ncbi:MAG: antitoxin [Thermoproteus sp.]|uniref:Antitoxin n=1 Tax=Thermoproteus uzoniensis (strain 768-20) TaxID=999630 RepID=F2L4L6_THEU7|nr:hypothetical protein [Thermoproteus uzoniensis]AEA12194.1 hypothetical protein TUZN_0704 [Thermoproteus uzoniensis 768-20]
MSEVISIRVRRELKRALEELGIDYAEEVRRFLEQLVARERRRRALERARSLREAVEREAGALPHVAELIREDRDGDSR